LREDQAVQKVLAEAERLAQEIERVAQQGKEPTKEQVEQYDSALQSVQSNPVYQQMVAAQSNFEKADGADQCPDLRGHQEGRREFHHHARMTFVVVEGPEGAGKSTLVRWLGTTLAPKGGPC